MSFGSVFIGAILSSCAGFAAQAVVSIEGAKAMISKMMETKCFKVSLKNAVRNIV